MVALRLRELASRVWNPTLRAALATTDRLERLATARPYDSEARSSASSCAPAPAHSRPRPGRGTPRRSCSSTTPTSSRSSSANARVLPDVEWALRRYGLRVTAAREAGHHTHGDGTAVDLVPAHGSTQATWDTTARRLATDLGWTPACASSGVAPVCPLKPAIRGVFYNGYPGHGDPAHAGADAHLHVSWYASHYGAAELVAPNVWVRVFPVPAAI